MKTHYFFRLLALVMLCISLKTSAQLPSDYVTKVSYYEKLTVSYSVVSDANINCLSLSELSKYHGYMQFYKMEEYVDHDGDLMTEQNYIYEENVRDAWMSGASRIVAGKQKMEMYDESDQLIYQEDRSLDSTDLFMTGEQSLDYGTWKLDNEFYDSLINQLNSMSIPFSESNGVVSFNAGLQNISYDHVGKISSNVWFDSLGTKAKEKVTEYALLSEANLYYPAIETQIEWMIGENGCCIKKTMLVERFSYRKETNDQSNNKVATAKGRLSDNMHHRTFEIETEINDGFFRITSSNQEAPIIVAIYDLNGKLLLSQNTFVGKRIQLPQAARAGMYLVHVSSVDGKNPTVGKVIRCTSKNSF